MYQIAPDWRRHAVNLTPMKSGVVGCACACPCSCCVSSRLTDDHIYWMMIREAMEKKRLFENGHSRYPLTSKEEGLILIGEAMERARRQKVEAEHAGRDHPGRH